MLNDPVETAAIRNALGSHADRVPVSATKPYHGHALGASGAIEDAIRCVSLRESWVHPILNLDEPAEGCDLDYVTGRGREGELNGVISNSFGFGGINAALVITSETQLS